MDLECNIVFTGVLSTAKIFKLSEFWNKKDPLAKQGLVFNSGGWSMGAAPFKLSRDEGYLIMLNVS